MNDPEARLVNGDRHLVCAAARVSTTPERPVALAGVEGRTQCWSDIASPLEANALLLCDGPERTLWVCADLLYFGPDLTQAVHAAAARGGIAPARVILAASHTHFAPATDRTKPTLGVVDEGALRVLAESLESLVDTVVAAPLLPVRVECTRLSSAASINRRRRWPLPTFTREGLRWGPSTVMAPAPTEPRDEFVDVLRFIAGNDEIVAVAWKFACHPVCFPQPLSVSSEFPGRARQLLREQQQRAALPVLFLQGFTGDVRPRLIGNPTLLDRVRVFRRGPGFSEVQLAQWKAWADDLADTLCRAARLPAARSIDQVLDVSCIDVPMAHLIDERAGVEPALPPMQIQRVLIGGCADTQVELLFFAAEVCSPYLALLGASERTLCVGYTGHVFGYLPSRQQIAEGGYEGGGYLARFGIVGLLRPGLEDAVVNAVAQLRALRGSRQEIRSA